MVEECLIFIVLNKIAHHCNETRNFKNRPKK